MPLNAAPGSVSIVVLPPSDSPSTSACQVIVRIAVTFFPTGGSLSAPSYAANVFRITAAFCMPYSNSCCCCFPPHIGDNSSERVSISFRKRSNSVFLSTCFSSFKASSQSASAFRKSPSAKRACARAFSAKVLFFELFNTLEAKSPAREASPRFKAHTEASIKHATVSSLFEASCISRLFPFASVICFLTFSPTEAKRDSCSINRNAMPYVLSALSNRPSF
mmetsp:Transcript_10781/g.30608  ORF Transcript_10781/g.30608 Transcript_10781/m.30608 type:complete len:221 (-) Transcript_10781:805-1467(-)